MKLDKRLLHETGSIQQYLGLTIGIGGLGGVLIILQAFCLTQIIDNVFLAGRNLNTVALFLVGWLALSVARAGLNWFSEITANRAAGQVKKQLRQRLFQHLFRLEPAYSQTERSGELSNTTIDGIESLDAYFSQYLPQMFIAALVPALMLAVVAWNDWLSGLILLLTAPILVIFMILIGKLAQAKTQRQWQTLSLLSAHFLDVLQGLTTLKLFGRSQKQIEIVERVSERFRQITLEVLRIAFLSALVMEFGATISVAIVAVEIGFRLLYSQIEFQTAFFVLLLAPEFYLPLRALGARFHASMAGGEAAQRVYEILDTKPETKTLEPPAPATTTITNFKASGSIINSIPNLTNSSIYFENVSCTYAKDTRPALENISFSIEPNQKVALVGPSGSGKSTIASLLLRFVEPSAGQIRIGGQALASFELATWRNQIAWVPQRPYLFNATVADNIRLGQPNTSLPQMIAAAQAAHAHEFIIALPQAYNTIIGERGTRLSGGQAQRLSLARAFLKDAPLLILDEATSNLDPATQALVVASLERFMLDRSVLMIAHRLETIGNADKIITLSHGQLVPKQAWEFDKFNQLATSKLN
jgi:thiol reductant ABC exporter CydD subunit